MVKLFCAIVGVAGSAFSVRVDEDDSVDDLKDAIKAKKPDTIKGEADKLKLFLAKKDEGRGPWVTEADVKGGVSDTHGLKLLDAAGAPLKWVDLSEDDVRFQITKELVKDKRHLFTCWWWCRSKTTSVPQPWFFLK